MPIFLLCSQGVFEENMKFLPWLSYIFLKLFFKEMVMGFSKENSSLEKNSNEKFCGQVVFVKFPGVPLKKQYRNATLV